MKRLTSTLIWDWRLQWRHHIFTVAAGVTALYVLVFLNLPTGNTTPLLITLLFSDPSLLAFMFIGALVLFEKSAGTHSVWAVMPVCPWHYLLSKALSLSLIALLCSLVMTVAAQGWRFNWLFLSLAVVMTSLLFAWLGFAGVARVTTFNQYLILIPMLVSPLFIPLMSLWGVQEYGWLYLVPTHASVILFRAAFGPVETGKILYAIASLLFWTGIAYWLAERAFIRRFLPSSTT